MSTKRPIWALLVSIRQYSHDDWPEVPGAHNDTQNVFDYLTNDLKVPAKNMRRLFDREASRANILSTFQAHLIDNPAIAQGDAILFYFSGHGSYLKAPEGWTVVEKKIGDDEKDDMVETIIPWDDGAILEDDDTIVCSIPDRTLAHLIDRAAAAHGNNITVVLDCCSSGHGTRGAEPIVIDGDVVFPRAIHPDALAPLRADLDLDIIASSNTSHALVDQSSHATVNGTVARRKGSFRALPASHVLLAACKPREAALGGKRGGLLTLLWISSMKGHLQPRTYAEVVKRINEQLEDSMKRAGFTLTQHPQCEGVVRDRLLFEETTIDRNQFRAAVVTGSGQGSSQRLTIEAGLIHGVVKGTIFEIYILDESLKGTNLGRAEAETVLATTTTARLCHWTLRDTRAVYTATIVLEPKLSYVFASTLGADFTAAQENFRRSLEFTPGIEEVKDEDWADLRVAFDADGAISLHRLDHLLGPLPNPVPRLTTDVEKDNVDRIFRGIARFNSLLGHTNPTHPFADKISFNMFRLLETDDQDEQGDFILRKADTPVAVENGSAIVAEDEEYAIVIRNDLPVDLYVQVWYFDPDTYSIDCLYESPNDAVPTLSGHGGTLQLGASTELALPLTYYLPNSEAAAGIKSTMFAKIYLTDERSIKLGSLYQGALIGDDASSDRADKPKESLETIGRWDTILQRITVQ